MHLSGKAENLRHGISGQWSNLSNITRK